MYRIDDNQNVADLPADPTDNVGTPGYFWGGTPGASPPVPPTRIRYWWLNMIQETLIDPILKAGLALAKDDFTQLTTAIQTLTPGRQLGRPTAYISSGSITTAPAGTNWYRALISGGGGSGGGAQAVTGTNTSVGAPGGSGAWAEIWIPWTGAAIPYTIGAGGVSSAGSAGNAGGASVLAGFTMPGGTGGGVGTVGGAPNGNGGSINGLPSGTGTSGAIMVASGQGQAGGLSLAATSSSGFGGPGAPSIFGGGSGFIGAEASGAVANTRGAGGGGTCNVNGNGALGGGPGVGGQVIFTPFA